MQANQQIVEELKGDDEMCEALMALMEPELLQREIEGERKGIQGAVDILRSIGQDDERIRHLIKEKYALTDVEVTEYL